VAKAKKPKFEKLSINMQRRGELRYEMAYTAREAASKATKAAKQGWDVKVQNWQSLGTNRNVQMTCTPSAGIAKTRTRWVAKCTVMPAFKKRLKGK